MTPIISYLVRSIHEEHLYQSKDIHHREGYLLRVITLAHLTQQQVRSSEFTRDRSLGSAPTIASALRRLVEKGLIRRKTDPTDRRNQWLIPTKHAIALFEELSAVGSEK